MPLIPYPDVPSVPGVPQLPIPPVGFVFPTVSVNLTTLATTDEPGIVNATPQWLITDANGSALITPDSVIDFEYRGEAKIPMYPIEQGGFAGYNKVMVPRDARITVSCGGNGEMTKDQFLSMIDSLRTGLTLCAIVTPDATYSNLNLVHVDYRRQAKQGVSLILAQLWFQEVMNVTTGTPPTSQPDGATAQQNGMVSPQTPTTAQAAAINATPPT